MSQENQEEKVQDPIKDIEVNDAETLESEKHDSAPKEQKEEQSAEEESDNANDNDLGESNMTVDPETDAIAETQETEEEEQGEAEAPAHIAKIKTARLDLDLMGQLVVKAFGEGLLYERVFLAKCWLGKTLGACGTKHPYPKADTVKAIPKTQDVAENPARVRSFGLMDRLHQVNYLRDMISEVAPLVLAMMQDEEIRKIDDVNAPVGITNSYINLCEAKFELGKILSKLRG